MKGALGMIVLFLVIQYTLANTFGPEPFEMDDYLNVLNLPPKVEE